MRPPSSFVESGSFGIRADAYEDIPPVWKNLELLRKLNGLTGADMARVMDVEPMSYYRYRRGEVVPPWDRVVLAAVKFQRSPEWFYADHYAAWVKAGVISG